MPWAPPSSFRCGTRTELSNALRWFLAAFFLFPFLASAQTANLQTSRITQAIDPNRLTTLRGNRHPLAQAQFDLGTAPPDLPMQRMLLVLNRSAQQNSDLDALLALQQDKASANYHHWLTPQQFGAQFGPGDQDMRTISAWLQSQGFQVNRLSNGRTLIEFSGTASQVQQAFHTEIHRYAVNGENHWANSADPQIPIALAPVIAGIATLHNFPRHPMHRVAGTFSRSNQSGEITPLQPSFTLGGQCGVPNVGCHGISPYDFATIYNVAPLWNSAPPIDGTGQAIAIVGESDITIEDVTDFRTFFGLPAAKLQIIHDGPDPGTVPGDETESTLDVEWSGAVARNATIDFVVSQSTETAEGVDLSAEYIVDNNLAPVLSESYGECERFLGTAGNQFYSQLWQQAAAQGITVLISTGDSGSASCDQSDAKPPAPATYGLTVSGIASTPYNVAVGGTDFNDLTTTSTYWNATNAVPPNTPAGTPATSSALSYIPEATWNDSCTDTQALVLLGYTSNAETDCNNSALVTLVAAVGGSGGRSNCTSYNGACAGGYAKPSWQTSVTPGDASRDLPDVSLYAAAGSPSGSFYIICEADQLPPGASSCNPAVQNTEFLAIGGTSASTPAFAGIMALVNQKTTSAQGNANYVLYALAVQQPNAFHDVFTGTIAMPCATGSSTDCVTSHPGDAYGVLSGYATSVGYDLATGLGSVDATQLVNAWATANTTLSPSTTTLSLNSGNAVNITHGQPVSLSIDVTPQSSSAATPSGSVSLLANVAPPGMPNQVTQQLVQDFALTGGSVASSTNLLPGGAYTVFAQYAGDGTFSSSQSAPVSVTVVPESSQTSLALELFNPTSGVLIAQNAATAPFGSLALLRMNVSSLSGATCTQNGNGQSGCATGSLTLTDNGAPLDSGTFALNSQGYAEDQTIQLLAGTHALKAVYSGDNSFTASTATDTVTITKAPTTITVQGPPNGIASFPVANFSVTISTQSVATSYPPTGTVQVYVSGAPLGAPVAVMGGSKSGFAVATVPVSETLPVGQDSVTVQYNGDTNYLPSPMSAPVAVHFLAPTNTNVTASISGNTVQQGQSITFTATVTAPLGGAPSPTGTIQFSSSVASTFGSAIALVNGQAQLTTASLPPGSQFISATYSGDANNVGSSGGVFLTVNANFTISANPSTITVAAPGQSGSTVLTFVAQNGFSSNGSADISSAQCSGLPAESTCSFSPASVSFPANGSATATLTVTTTAPSQKTAGANKRRMDFRDWKAGNLFEWGGLLCMSLLLFRLVSMELRWSSAIVLVLFGVALAAAGCGGGGGSAGTGNNSTPPTVTDPGTPPTTTDLVVSLTINGSTETKIIGLVIQ